MKVPLRKTSEILSISYRGGYTTSLFGQNFMLDIEGELLTLCIDLGRNLRFGADENEHIDARELARRHAELQSVEISDEQIADGLERWSRPLNSPRFFLSLSLGELGEVPPVAVQRRAGRGDRGVRLTVLPRVASG